MSKILALLAKLPASSSAVDWVSLVVVALACLAVSSGALAPDDLPAAIDAALALLPVIGLRAASLWSKAKLAKAADEGAALAALVAKARADGAGAVSAEALEHAEALIALARPAGSVPLKVVE
jgi:hypothetical protein